MTFRVMMLKACPVVACFAFALAGCSDDDDDDDFFAATPQGRMEVLATDAPPTFSTLREVTLRIVRIDAIGNVTSGAANQTVTLFNGGNQPQEIDLLPLKGGQTETIASAPIPAGTYDQLRLFVSGAEVVTQGPDATQPTTFSTDNNGTLTLAGGTQEGALRVYDVDLAGDGVVVETNETARVLLDFDLQESLEAEGNPSAPTAITFTPVIRGRSLGTTGAAQGSIRGVVRSNEGTVVTNDDVPVPNASVVVLRDSEIVAQTRTDAQGVFAIEGIEAGDYVLVVDEPGFVAQQNDIQTQEGQVLTSDVLLVERAVANNN